MDAVEKHRLFSRPMHMEADNDLTNTRLPILPRHTQGITGTMPSCSLGKSTNNEAKEEVLGITQAVMPGGKRIKLLKTMMTSACERNCNYCSFRAGRNYQRSTFTPEEMASSFMNMYRAGLVEGLFLSSGIIRGGISTQDKIIDTAEILRHQLGFRGYIHLKIMPGAENDQVYRSMQLANRVSVNLEAPNAHRLTRIAPKKVFLNELLEPLQKMDEIRKRAPAHACWNGRWASSSTQFVVGAAGESDVELLTTTGYLLKQYTLRRAYFMAFKPIPDTPLENQPPENPWRQHRLYQASYLLRDYGFELEELPFKKDGRLPLTADPKTAWARDNLLEAPVEVNLADPEELLRVPGIGPKGVTKILSARRSGKLQELKELKAIGVSPSRPAPYLLLNGKRPTFQLALF
ncbi:MAG: putative DNA modification/repair radical SAM protein [Anaerolineae bacterium]|nr:MAG: putative DNA modification/repair radical SAM protein [Anaerolineae bacterium]